MGWFEDVGNFVTDTAKDTVKAIASPVEAALDVAKGDNKAAGERFVKAAGTIADAGTRGTSRLLSTDAAQVGPMLLDLTRR